MTKNAFFCDFDVLKNVPKFQVFSVLKIKISCAQAWYNTEYALGYVVIYRTWKVTKCYCVLLPVLDWNSRWSLECYKLLCNWLILKLTTFHKVVWRRIYGVMVFFVIVNCRPHTYIDERILKTVLISCSYDKNWATLWMTGNLFILAHLYYMCQVWLVTR